LNPNHSFGKFFVIAKEKKKKNKEGKTQHVML